MSKSRRRRFILASASSAEGGGASFRPKKGTPGVDTRIHWDNPDEGWVGGSTRKKTDTTVDDSKKESFSARFADLISASATSHYQFLGITPDADMEEVKAAYRRLSKEYHPDTTSLPLKTASAKFMQLREAYNVLSNEESRKFYDWTLAKEAESLRAQRMRKMLEDPYEQEVANFESVPDMVDRLEGRNMKLSDQAMTALTIDIVIILFSICCIIYVLVFKEPYY